MSLYSEIYPPAETVLEMEPEELAPFVLRHLSRAGSGKLNRHNFLLGTDTELVAWAGSYPQAQAVLERFAIAWMWLERELFIAPQPGNNDWTFITHRGKKVLESQDFNTYRQEYLLPSDGLDPILVRKVKQSFVRGDYDTAVFQAFKEVEVRVREKTGLAVSDIGVPLMRKAFNPTNGLLSEASADAGEKTARMELFAGAIGAFKNPSSHRYTDLSDPHEVADIIHIANHLLRIIDSLPSPTP
jgi:uncharacterized protein (TIGR02391 family)